MTPEQEEAIRANYARAWEADQEMNAKEAKAREAEILAIAERSGAFNCDHGIEIGDPSDAHVMVSEGEDNGAYVRAWVWVSFEGTPLDKEEE
tara:strand:- start:703 stop:978 length:276 start_codon:yes stop_codon:yes gene_type:complete